MFRPGSIVKERKHICVDCTRTWSLSYLLSSSVLISLFGFYLKFFRGALAHLPRLALAKRVCHGGNVKTLF
jgi:hypothetical protein